MLTTIGSRPSGPTPEDAVSRLLGCHERIRSMTALAVTLSRAPAAPASEIAEAASRVWRYFTEALPLHSADEDQSVAPRLTTVIPACAEMVSQHLEIVTLLERLAPRWARIAAEPAALATLAEAPAASDVTRLAALFEAHLALEEQFIFPAIRGRLSPAEGQAIVDEMKARRA